MADIRNKYSDETHIQDDDEIAQEIDQGEVDEHSHTLATQIREKMYGIDVRESLARLVEFLSIRYNKLFHRQDDVEGRQSNIESRQDNIEDKLDDVIANATTDSEVILGRDSSSFGKFKTLDDRLENDEDLISSIVPTEAILSGATQSFGRHPRIFVLYYENAVGTSGFLQNDVVFGDSVVVPVGITYLTSNKWTVKVPKKYYIKASSVASTTEKNVWYKTIEDGTTSKTLRIEFKKEV